MLKKLGFLSVAGLCAINAQTAQAQMQYTEVAPMEQYQYLQPVQAPAEQYQYPQPVQAQAAQQNQQQQQQQAKKPQVQMPTSIIVCRSKQCAPAKLSQSKEYIFNTLLHMFDSNARQKALICEGNSQTHACTEEYVSVPITVGVTPAYMYLDNVKITDVSINPQNTTALNLILNWNVTYNGQTPTCRPSKTLLHVKNVNNVLIQDNGYTCRMTTIGTTTIQTMFAVDYIDLDYGYIGGFYSIGLSGPAFGGGNGYMILRLPNDVTIEAKDFNATATQDNQSSAANPFAPQAAAAPAAVPAAPVTNTVQPAAPAIPQVQQPAAIGGQYIYNAYTGQFIPLPVAPAPYAAPTAPMPTTGVLQPVAGGVPVVDPNHVQAPNVSSIIKYNHPAQQYDEAQELARIRAERDAQKKEHMRHELERRKQMEKDAVEYGGAKVFPLPASNKIDKTAKPGELKNSISEYAPQESRRFE